jgi:hypothetical protein
MDTYILIFNTVIIQESKDNYIFSKIMLAALNMMVDIYHKIFPLFLRNTVITCWIFSICSELSGYLVH